MARTPKQKGNREMSETDPTILEAQNGEAGETALPDPSELPEPELVSFMEKALNRLSIESLGRIGEAVRQTRQSKQEEARQTMRQRIEEELQASGLSLRDLFPDLHPTPGRKRGESGPILPKYRGPNGETWSGRGHQPRWLAALEATGRTKDEFRIQEEIGASPTH